MVAYKFSVIIPTYNRKNFLIEAVDSVLKQTFKDFEIIIVDDNSSDGTKDIILNRYKDLISSGILRYIYLNRNYGVSKARNVGIINSKGEYIALLDSDDLWKKRKLEKQYEFLEKNKEFFLVHTDEEWYKNGKYLNQKKYHKKKGGDIFDISLERCMISPSSVVINKEFLLNKIGLFDENLPAVEDYDLWLRITAFYEVGYIEEKLVIKRGGHTDQLSTNIKILDKYRVYSMVKLLNTYYNIIEKAKLYKLLKILEIKLNILEKGAKKHNNKEILDFVKENKHILNYYSEILNV